MTGDSVIYLFNRSARKQPGIKNLIPGPLLLILLLNLLQF